MNPKALIALAAATVVVTVAAVAVLAARDGDGAQRFDAPVVPGLVDKANDVTALVVQDATRTFSVVRGAGGWSIPEKGGYPAKADIVRKTIIDLASLRLAEPKTRVKDSHARLEVEDPAGKDAKSRLLTVKAGDRALAEIVVGKRKVSSTGKGREGIYLRLAREDQSWFATGDLALRADPVDWMDKRLANVGEERVAEIRIVHKGGEQIIIDKADPKAKEFRIANPPAGREAGKETADKLKSVVLVLDELDFTDVRKAEGTGFAAPDLAVTVVAADGLIVELAGVKEGDQTWFTLAASTDAALADLPAPVKDEAAAINAKAKGFAFTVADYKTRNVSVTLDTLLK